MMKIDFSELRPVRKPTKKEKALYRRWVKYLSDSNMTEDEVHNRAAEYTTQRQQVPKD